MRPDPTRCLLLIDDEPAQRRLVTAIGARAGWWVRGAPDVDSAAKMLTDVDGPPVDAILLDHWLPGPDGTGVIAQIRALRPDLPLAGHDRPDLGRGRGRGDARRRPRFPGQADRARQPARGPERRHRPAPARRRRASPALREDLQPAARLRGDRRFGAALPLGARRRRQGRPGPGLGPDRGRERLGQGSDRPGDPHRVPSRPQADDHGQLRGDPRESRRIGALRP